MREPAPSIRSGDMSEETFSIENAKFEPNLFSRVHFAECDITDTLFECCKFHMCIFTKCTFTNCGFDSCKFSMCEFEYCVFDSKPSESNHPTEEIIFSNTKISRCVFKNCTINSPMLTKCGIQLVEMERTTIKYAIVSNSSIYQIYIGIGSNVIDLCSHANVVKKIYITPGSTTTNHNTRG